MYLVLKPYLNAYGVKIDEGYFELLEVDYKTDNNILYFAGHIWVSKEAREEGFAPIDKFEDSFELDELPEENLLRFTYRHIQETASAEDVMTMHPKYKGFIDSTFIQD